MKRLLSLLLAFLFSPMSNQISQIEARIKDNPRKDNPIEFVVVIPSYNNEQYARRNLESVITQQCDVPFSIIYVNDCSKDGTRDIVESLKKEYGLHDAFLKIINNPVRIGALANIYHTVHNEVKDHQIVVHLDGDDALAHTKVLQHLSKEYQDPNLYMTYGQFVFVPEGPGGRLWGTTYEIPREALLNKKVRTLVYVAQHLRTFKAGLFKKIKIEDLQLNGKFYEMNADMATMIPMLEMSAPRDMNSPNHSKFIPDIMCMYTYNNPINDHVVNRNLQLELEEVIRALPPYEPLDSLD